jgi:hypothetical protein
MNFTQLLSVSIAKAGKHETLAALLDVSPSGLSKRINGEVGWAEKEINALLEYAGYEVLSIQEYTKKINTLKEAMKILLNSGGTD